MTRQKNIEWIIVIVLSVLSSLAGSIMYFSYVFHTPPHTVNLGVTHYWEDYMYYISQFTQGAHGSWLNYAMFTEEALSPTFLHYPNILLGKIGGLIHLNPVDFYNICNIVLSCAFLMLTYYCLTKLFPKPQYASLSFLFFLFSSSLLNRLPDGGDYQFYPYLLWNTPHYMFARIDAIPHHLVINILLLIELFLMFHRVKHRFMYVIYAGVLCILSILQPVAATLFVGIYWITSIISHDARDWKKIGSMSAGYLIGALYLIYLYFTNDYVNGMTIEAQWQTRTDIPFLMKSIGPIVPFAVLGMLFRWKKAVPIERFGMILLLGAYALFLLPVSGYFGVSNLRLLFSAQYLFWGWFAAVGLMGLADYLKHIVVLRKNVIIGLLFFVYFISVAPTIVWELREKIPHESLYQDPLYFLPKPTYDAFVYLSTQKPLSSLVLANPSSRMDILIPALSGHKTVTGLRFTTLNFQEKSANAIRFFTLGMEKSEALRWLESHHMDAILFTVYDGDREAFQRSYPFLIPTFSTKTAAVFVISK